jgi:hypothetical protein
MVILPRLARALNAPLIAAVLGLILIAVAIIGLATDDIRTRWAIIILVVGAINVLRAIPQERESS